MQNLGYKTQIKSTINEWLKNIKKGYHRIIIIEGMSLNSNSSLPESIHMEYRKIEFQLTVIILKEHNIRVENISQLKCSIIWMSYQV